MKKTLTVLCLLAACHVAMAQRLDYAVDFWYFFDNGEFAYSHDYFEPSGTTHAVALTPRIGVKFEKSSITHTFHAGLDFRKDMGDGKVPDAGEILLYYRFDDRISRKSSFSGILGAFPRSFSEGVYPTTFFSDYNHFADRFYEGAFFKYKTERSYVELGLDWMGKKSETDRERFQILSYGNFLLGGPFRLGYAARMYHFAGSGYEIGVVDNHMAHAFVEFRPALHDAYLSITAGAIGTYQWDRRFDDMKKFPFGALSTQEFRWHGWGVNNSFYFGQDLMPMFTWNNNLIMYGTRLYQGEMFYHTQIDGFSIYDAVELYYEWKPVRALSVKAAITAHIGNPTAAFGFFRGWQQVISVRYSF